MPDLAAQVLPYSNQNIFIAHPFQKGNLENDAQKYTESIINIQNELNNINKNLSILEDIDFIYKKMPGEQSQQAQRKIQKAFKLTVSILEEVGPKSTDKIFEDLNKELGTLIKSLIKPLLNKRKQDNEKMSDLRQIMNLLRQIEGNPNETINYKYHDYEFNSKKPDFLIKHSPTAKLRDELNKICQIFNKNPKDDFILSLQEGPRIVLRAHRKLFVNLQYDSVETYELTLSDYPILLSELKKENIELGRAYDSTPKGPKLREAIEAYGYKIPITVSEIKNLCEKLEAEAQSLSFTGQVYGTSTQRLTYLHGEAMQLVSIIIKQLADIHIGILLRCK